MLTIRRILFPTDFSAVAEDAFAHAAHLAMQHNAEIHVFNVVAPDQAEATNPMTYLPLEAEENGFYRMPASNVGAGDEAPAHDVHVAYEQKESDAPSTAITEQAKTIDADLIVMGTHGRQGIDRILSGSVAEHVVRTAPCPVLAVRSDGEGPLPTQSVSRVLAPLDLSKTADTVADHATALADTYDARLDLLHVVEEVVYPNVYNIDPITPMLNDIQERARAAVDSLAQRASEAGVAADVHITVGYAAHEILSFAEANDSGLIVMATHGRTGLERFLIGSVAEKVVRGAPCPVFVLKPNGKSLLTASA
ncbi:universal stress protein [Salisaeta longa]|uniref:universal stress protein n=1 Tax=Salisaeta longa TaxID=503170 RepID=UPI0004913854|nr:universal stress protein [Salisaeta longa]